ncbi:MAG TPA: hypothetical protein VFQ42_22190 [Mycobacterium sp.]|nr:hypothetical protein [Mycobacterium sp.]
MAEPMTPERLAEIAARHERACEVVEDPRSQRAAIIVGGSGVCETLIAVPELLAEVRRLQSECERHENVSAALAGSHAELRAELERTQPVLDAAIHAHDTAHEESVHELRREGPCRCRLCVAVNAYRKAAFVLAKRGLRVTTCLGGSSGR